jgi:hypothetical protein
MYTLVHHSTVILAVLTCSKSAVKFVAVGLPGDPVQELS